MSRARLHPPGTSASGRFQASLRRLAAAGGARKTIRLSKQGLECMAVIRGNLGLQLTDNEVIGLALEGYASDLEEQYKRVYRSPELDDGPDVFSER